MEARLPPAGHDVVFRHPLARSNPGLGRGRLASDYIELAVMLSFQRVVAAWT